MRQPLVITLAQTFVILAKLIELSCIDLLDELRETRRAIIEAKRADLDARLGIFPFDQQEAIRRGSLWDKSSAIQRLELERKWKEDSACRRSGSRRRRRTDPGR